MVAPSAFSKDSQPSIGGGAYQKSEKGGGDKESQTVAVVELPLDIKDSKAFALGVIMNPAVLSIIAFPNRCMLKKSDKYVVNGITLPPGEKDNNDSSTAPKTSQKSSSAKRYLGLILAILSSMMFSFTGLIVKIVSHHHPLTQATWMFIATVIVAIPLNLYKYACTFQQDKSQKCDQKRDSFKQHSEISDYLQQEDQIKKEKQLQAKKCETKIVINEKLQVGFPPVEFISDDKVALQKSESESERRRKIKLFILLLIRACSGCSGMILYFYSLKYLNVGDSLVIVCSSPIFVFIFGYLFFGESCGVIPVLTIFLSMFGVAVITRPPMLTGKEAFHTDELIGAGLAFSSMMCIAINLILMRFLQNVYHGLINLVFGIWGTFQTTLLALSIGVLECPHNLQDALLMMATGVFFFMGQTCLAVALQLEQAGPVSLVRTSEVVFAFLWQFIFLAVSPDIFSISGAVLILAGILLTISRKWIASLPEDATSRRIFSFLLR